MHVYIWECVRRNTETSECDCVDVPFWLKLKRAGSIWSRVAVWTALLLLKSLERDSPPAITWCPPGPDPPEIKVVEVEARCPESDQGGVTRVEVIALSALVTWVPAGLIFFVWRFRSTAAKPASPRHGRRRWGGVLEPPDRDQSRSLVQ